MRMLKLLMIAVLALALTLGASACGGDDESEAADGAAQTGEATAEGETSDLEDAIADRPIVFDLTETGASGVSGSVELVATGETETTATVTLSGGEPDAAHEVAVLRGDCDNPDESAFAELGTSEGGTASGTVDESLIQLLDGEFIVAVMQEGVSGTEDDAPTMLACAEVPDRSDVQFDPE